MSEENTNKDQTPEATGDATASVPSIKDSLESNGIDCEIFNKRLLADDDGGIKYSAEWVTNLLGTHANGYVAISIDARGNQFLIPKFSADKSGDNTAYYNVMLFKSLLPGGNTGQTNNDYTVVGPATAFYFHLGYNVTRTAYDVLFHASFPLLKDKNGKPVNSPTEQKYCFDNSEKPVLNLTTSDNPLARMDETERIKQIARLHSISPTIFNQYLLNFWKDMVVPIGYPIAWFDMNTKITNNPDKQLRFDWDPGDMTSNHLQLFYIPDLDIHRPEKFTNVDTDYTFDLMRGINALMSSNELRFYKGLSAAGNTLLIENVSPDNQRQYFDLNSLHP